MIAKNLIEIIKARIWLVVAMPLVAAATALVVSVSVPKEYRAKATILLDYHRKALEGELAGEFLPATLQANYLSTQIGIIRSRPVAEGVVESLDLTASKTWKDRFDEVADKDSVSMKEWLVNVLNKNLSVTSGKDSRLIDIWYQDAEAKMAADIANAFVKSYKEYNKNLSREPVLETAESVEDLLATLRSNLAQAENAVTEYQEKMGIMASDERLDVETRRLNELMQEKTEAEFALQAAEGRLNSVKSSGLQDNPVIQKLQLQIAEKEGEFAELGTSLGRQHPRMRKLSAELHSLNQRLAAERVSVASGLRSQYREAQRLVDLAQKAEADQKRKVMELKRLRDGLQPLLRELDSARQAYDRALSMYSEYAMHSNMDQTNISLLSSAQVPLEPSSPKILRNVAGAFVSGMVLAVVLILIWEAFDMRIRRSEEIQGLGDAGYLGELPKI